MKSRPADAESMSIGEIARHFGLATHVLRHWEAVGLLAPAREAGARRRYNPDDVFRVAMILRAKEAGFGLADIRAVITAHDPAARTAILRQHRVELAQRIAAAQVSLELIDGALGCDHDDLIRCPHFRSWVTERIDPTLRPRRQPDRAKTPTGGPTRRSRARA